MEEDNKIKLEIGDEIKIDKKIENENNKDTVYKCSVERWENEYKHKITSVEEYKQK